MKASLTVFFEDPFWVGVFERIEDGKLSVCKVTFGAEPKDYEVWDYVLHHYYELIPREGAGMREGNWRMSVLVRNPNKLFKDSGKK